MWNLEKWYKESERISCSALPTLSPRTVARQAPPTMGFSSKKTGVGIHSLLQGIFPTQGLNPGFPHCRQILYCLSHQGSPEKLYRWSYLQSRNRHTNVEHRSHFWHQLPPSPRPEDVERYCPSQSLSASKCSHPTQDIHGGRGQALPNRFYCPINYI